MTKRRESRADDQGRLAEECARGTEPAKRKPGRPRTNTPPIAEPNRTEEEGPPETEPDAVDEGPPKDELGRPLSILWAEMRGDYEPSVRRQVENLMRLGALELDDLVWVEVAEHAEMQRLMFGATERFQEQLVSSRLQSRKQLMRILVERGPIGGANARSVRVPEGMSLDELPAADTGDDVLAEPDLSKLPAHLKAAAEAQRKPTPAAPP